jgi:hypothetical protein
MNIKNLLQWITKKKNKKDDKAFVKHVIKEAKIKRQDQPCSEHVVAAPTFTEADMMGMLTPGVFLRKCDVCGWYVLTKNEGWTVGKGNKVVKKKTKKNGKVSKNKRS